MTAPSTNASRRLIPHIPPGDWERLGALPWDVPLGEWAAHGVPVLSVRRGESRHEVVFVEVGNRRYAIKETSPQAAEHETRAFEELRRRGSRALEPVGWIHQIDAPVAVGEIGGRALYLSGDTGYCITRLAEHVLPQSILYRYPFTDANKRLLWSAIAELLVNLHESGVYWGDPSLANILIDLSGQRLTAVMADAETAQLVQGPLSEGHRQQDLDSFLESLEWQAEDIRLARDWPDDWRVVTDMDGEYFLARYRGLRALQADAARRAARERSGRLHPPRLVRAQALHRRLRQLHAMGYGVVYTASHAGRQEDAPEGTMHIATLRPGWYAERVRELLGLRDVPRSAAPLVYHHLCVHKWLLSERAGRDVGMDTTARDWLERYHRPLMRVLSASVGALSESQRYALYLDILDHSWEMSQREQREVVPEEGAMDYLLAQGRAENEAIAPALDGS